MIIKKVFLFFRLMVMVLFYPSYFNPIFYILLLLGAIVYLLVGNIKDFGKDVKHIMLTSNDGYVRDKMKKLLK